MPANTDVQNELRSFYNFKRSAPCGPFLLSCSAGKPARSTRPYRFYLCGMITRIAPTPSGFLHPGNIFNFLLNWHWARSNNGKVLLRIDDADAERKRTEYVEDIFRVLDWLGIDWDLGPAGPDDLEKNWSQLHRKEMYDGILQELTAKELIYACECTRTQLASAPCECIDKHISLDKAGIAWRMPTKGEIITFTDKAAGEVKHYLPLRNSFVVRRKDGIAAYHLASLADDRHFGVTHIGRGEDLLPSTAMQLHLDGLLDKSYLSQCTFWHHSLITGDNGTKLSKSAGEYGRSIMHYVKKEQLIASFEKWIGANKKSLTEIFG